MPRRREVFHAVVSPATEPIRVPGKVARFKMADGRWVNVYVPSAVSCCPGECQTVGFRVEVLNMRRRLLAVLSAGDLFGVFGAKAASHALEAFVAGDLIAARHLVSQAGAAWKGLGRLLDEVSEARASSAHVTPNASRAQRRGR